MTGQRSQEICQAGLRLRHSEKLAAERSELESFLFDAVYRHPRLLPVREAAARRLHDLFDVLIHQANRLPLRFRKRSENVPLERVVGEYLAGMTDAFCDAQWASIGKSETGPLADW